MDTDQIAEWQSCTASSVTSAFDHETPSSDFLDILQDDASDSGHSDSSIVSDTDLLLLIKDIYSYDQLPSDLLPLKRTDTSAAHRYDPVQLSSTIKHLVKETFKDRLSVGTSPSVIPTHSGSSSSLPTELVMVVKMTVESVLQEVRQLPNVVTRGSVKPAAVYRAISSDLHMDLWPVGDFLKAVLSNPWSERSIMYDLEFDRMLFDTACDHFAAFSHAKRQQASDDDGMEVSEDDYQDEAEETDQDKEQHVRGFFSGVFQQPQLVHSIPGVSARPFDLMEDKLEHRRQHKRPSRFKYIFIVITFLAFLLAMFMTIQVCILQYHTQPQIAFAPAVELPTASPKDVKLEDELANIFSALASCVNSVELSFRGLRSATWAWFFTLSSKSFASIHVGEAAFGLVKCVVYACIRYFS